MLDCSEEALLLIVLFGHLHYSERRVAQLAGQKQKAVKRSFRKDRKEGKLKSGVN
jgi:hypothetical protein